MDVYSGKEVITDFGSGSCTVIELQFKRELLRALDERDRDTCRFEFDADKKLRQGLQRASDQTGIAVALGFGWLGILLETDDEPAPTMLRL